MGIKGLHNFLKTVCPTVFKYQHISTFNSKKVAIDASIYLYKSKVCYGDFWMQTFVTFICSLRRYNIHPIFIFDTNIVPEKLNERKERALKKESLSTKVYTLQQSIDNFHRTSIIDSTLLDLSSKCAPSRFLSTSSSFNINAVQASVDKLKQQIVSITPTDITFIKKLLECMSIPFYDAPFESETSCSDICKRGLVDAVMTEDSDIFVYGTPLSACKYNYSDSMCTTVLFSDILKELELTETEFVEFCILCGSDYNKNIPKIGPKKSYDLIRKFKSIDNIKQNIPDLDISPLNHVRIKEIFTKYAPLNIDHIPYCGKPNYLKLDELFQANNIRLGVAYVKKCVTYDIKFEEEKK